MVKSIMNPQEINFTEKPFQNQLFDLRHGRIIEDANSILAHFRPHHFHATGQKATYFALLRSRNVFKDFFDEIHYYAALFSCFKTQQFNQNNQP